MIRNYRTNNSKNNFYQRVKTISESVFNKQRDAMRNEINGSKKDQEIYEIKEGRDSVKWTEIAMVFISAILAYFTWQLFNTATEQSKYAQQAADAAIKAVKQDSSNVAYTDSVESINDNISRKKDTLAINLANKSLETQINSIKETQQIFEKTTQPFLQLIDPEITTFNINKPLEIKYTIENLSDIPVKVISQKTVMIFRVVPPKLAEIRKQLAMQGDPVNYYITKQTPFSSTFHFQILNPAEYKGVSEGPFYICILREITYRNLVTNKIREYLIYAKFKPIQNSPNYPNGTYYYFIYNENYNRE